MLIRLHIHERKKNETSECSIVQFSVKKRPLPLRVKQTIGAIGEGLTTKRRRFGDRYFRSGRFLPPSFPFPSLPPVCRLFRELYRRFYEGQNSEKYRCSLRRSWSAPGDVKELGPQLSCGSARRGSVENGSAVLRFVSHKKRTYVTHYPCCGPCSKLWLSSTSSAARALVPWRT